MNIYKYEKKYNKMRRKAMKYYDKICEIYNNRFDSEKYQEIKKLVRDKYPFFLFKVQEKENQAVIKFITYCKMLEKRKK